MSFVKIRSWVAGLLMLALVGCGGGGGGASDAAGTPVLPGTGSGGGTGGGGVAVQPAYALGVRLVSAAGSVTSGVEAGQPVRAEAVLTRDGVAVEGEIVQFAVEQSVDLVKLDPVSGSQLTDATGKASVTVSSLGASTGAGRVQASAKIGTVTVTGAANFFATGSGGSQPAALVLGAPSILSPSVSAYGTTGIQVQVTQSGQAYTSPVTVTFTSSCAAGKATITSSAITQSNGQAVATFVDNGCAQNGDSNVTITASIGTDTKSATVLVRAPTSGSLRFVSASPSDKSITLSGQGGSGRQENATLTFQLVDVAGNGVGNADICFDATTYIGGLNLDGFMPTKLPAQQGLPSVCGNDLLSLVRYVKRTNADGTVIIQINSGTVPTPVRVRARALYPSNAVALLETYSDTLSISTGQPLQRSFSLSVDKANIDGGNFDGEIAKVTARLADQFSNPVPDGTTVSFIASGAAVCTSSNGACKTVNGACSCDLVSQARRPLDNRVVVTAYADGLEDFDDNNGSNVYDIGDTFYDLGDAYVDADKSGLPSIVTINGDTDILVPYQQNTGFRAAGDGVRGRAHIRASTVIYLSQASSAGDPTVVVPIEQLNQEHGLLANTTSSYFLRLTPVCPEGAPVPQATLSLALDDGIGNPMASGTSLTSVDASDNINPAGFRPGTVLAIGARAPSPLVDLPNLPKVTPWSVVGASGNVVTGHSVTVRGVTDKCSGDASFALDVASPRGGAATARVLYDGEPRLVSRRSFDVRYRYPLNLTVSSVPLTGLIDAASFVGPAGGAKASTYTINWGDGTVINGVGPLISASDQLHVYAPALASTTVNVRVSVTAGGLTYSNSSSLVVRP